MLGKFENAARMLFLRFGLPSTLIRHDYGGGRLVTKPGKLESVT